MKGARIISEFLQRNTSSLWNLQLSGEPMEGVGEDKGMKRREGKSRENPEESEPDQAPSEFQDQNTASVPR